MYILTLKQYTQIYLECYIHAFIIITLNHSKNFMFPDKKNKKNNNKYDMSRVMRKPFSWFPKSLLSNRLVCALISHVGPVHNCDWNESQDGDTFGTHLFTCSEEEGIHFS